MYEWSTLSIISKEENQSLSDFGLVKIMPEDWDYGNKYSRDEKVGTELIPSRYKELKNHNPK
jgi:hypothetical protein